MKNNPVRVLILFTLLLWPNFSFAQQVSATSRKPPEQLGKLNFPTSCQPAVQTTFERGVALLHSFWWQEGEKTFREVLDRDPNCAIATWGIAAILIGNTFATGPTPEGAQRAQEAIAQYYDRFGERSHGARMKSLADAFEGVAQRLPDDDEAQIFYAGAWTINKTRGSENL